MPAIEKERKRWSNDRKREKRNSQNRKERNGKQQQVSLTIFLINYNNIM